MSEQVGRFVWYELMALDTAKASAFYSAVVGWKGTEVGHLEPYTLLSAGAIGVGGIMTLSKPMRDASARAGWVGYVAVDDVDAAAKRVSALGGVVHRPPGDIPEIGRFAPVSDPQGAGFILFRPKPGGQMPAPAADDSGTFCWRELLAEDWVAVWPFYSELFGWQKRMTVDMGPMGVYQTFGTPGAEPDLGGMMTHVEPPAMACWQYTVTVEDITAGAARVVDAGGKLIRGPHPVPGARWIVHCTDLEGARFNLVASK